MNVIAVGFAALLAANAMLAAAASPASAASNQASNQTMPTCAAGDPVVWENTGGSKKVYHVSGDKYYGTTKKGQYVCQSAATSAGYHAAKSSPSSDASPAAKHHRHHKSSASPLPMTTNTPPAP